MSKVWAEAMERYGWASLAEPMCATLVRQRSSHEVLAGLAREVEVEEGPGSLDAARQWLADDEYQTLASLVWAVPVGDWTLAVEEIGWQGSNPAVAAALSVGTKVVSYYWSVNADMTFTVAEDGAIVRQFDPLLEYDEDGVARRGMPLPEEGGLPFGLNGARQASFALMERLTGVSVQPELATPDRLAQVLAVG
jgi:hypothetical protein